MNATRLTPSTECDCCGGIHGATPQRMNNPPGLSQIAYRVGQHGDFVASMRARLSGAEHPALAALTSREASDFTLAISDALACSLDVLSFYAERFAQEHYLRTATERLSIREMARLIGYQLSPGVAASTHLAFTLQATPGAPDTPITIPMGTRVQSVPRQDEKAQSFETVAPVPARAGWNALSVQTTRAWWPQQHDTELWLDGLATQLQAGDAILIVGKERQDDVGSERWDVRVLASVEPDNALGRTRVTWAHPLGSDSPAMRPPSVGVEVHAFRQRAALFGHNAPDANLMGNGDSNVNHLIEGNTLKQWVGFHINPSAIDLDTENAKISAGSWIALVSNNPAFGSAALPGYTELYRAAQVSHLSRTSFAMSGKVTRIKPDTTENLTSSRYKIRDTLVLAQSERLATADTPLFHPVHGDTIALGSRVPDVLPGQALALAGPRQRIAIAAGVTGLALQLDAGGSEPLAEGDGLFMLASADKLTGSTASALGAEALFDLLQGSSNTVLRMHLIDRDGRTGTLTATCQQLCLAGRQKDDPLVAEIAFIATTSGAISHNRDRTTLKLQAPLGHVYARADLRLNANVAPATHGETIEALLGHGDSRVSNARFELNQAPLTFVSANAPSGRSSTLELRVNDVLWREVPTLHSAAPDARVYATHQDDEAKTTLLFGDGEEGARLPSGTANLRVRYRKGIGTGGNLAADQITTLLSRPLGVTAATNPAPATGGEDAETLARARDNAPLTVLTLERAVSIDDYAHFARAFAGIAKAHALWIPAGPARGVFLTVTGIDGAAVPPASNTFNYLREALIAHGDPLVPLRMNDFVDVRFRCRLSVKVRAEYETDAVLLAVEAALRAHFSFAQRDFGQTVSVDEVSAVAQGLAGVEAVHVSRLYRVGQSPHMIVPRLFARLPVASLTAVPQAAELLTLANDPVELEVLP
jgi:hypothetical protein